MKRTRTSTRIVHFSGHCSFFRVETIGNKIQMIFFLDNTSLSFYPVFGQLKDNSILFLLAAPSFGSPEIPCSGFWQLWMKLFFSPLVLINFYEFFKGLQTCISYLLNYRTTLRFTTLFYFATHQPLTTEPPFCLNIICWTSSLCSQQFSKFMPIGDFWTERNVACEKVQEKLRVKS